MFRYIFVTQVTTRSISQSFRQEAYSWWSPRGGVSIGFFYCYTLAMSVLLQRLELIASKEELNRFYEYWTGKDKEVFQLLIWMIDTWLINEYRSQFDEWYAAHHDEFTGLQMEVFEKWLSLQRIDHAFVTHDRQYDQFVEIMNQEGANMYRVVRNPWLSWLSYFAQDLEILSTRTIDTTQSIEEYLQKQLSYHQADIRREIEKKVMFWSKHWRTKQEMITMEQPKQQFKFAADGTVSMENQTEMEVWHDGKEIVLQEHLHASPYFLYAGLPEEDLFIWKYYYKNAMLSYTSERAHEIRFWSGAMVVADLLISDNAYKKIYVRWEGDDDRYYYVKKKYDDTVEDLYVDEFTKQESGLAEISHLVSLNQDLVFRAAIQWTVLVEGVSWSGKTNLIFHRIDYLLQEYPKQFSAERMLALSPSDILAAYMKSALKNTQFAFKDQISIALIDDCYTNIHIPEYTSSWWTSLEVSDCMARVDSYSNTVSEVVTEKLHALIPEILETVQKYCHDALKIIHEKQKSATQDRFVSSHERTRLKEDGKLLEEMIRCVQSHEEPVVSVWELKSLLQKRMQDCWYVTQYSAYIDEPLYRPRYHDDSIFWAVESQIEWYRDTLIQWLVCSWVTWWRLDWLKIQLHREKTMWIPLNTYVESENEWQLLIARIAHSLHDTVWVAPVFTSYDYILVDEFQDFRPLQLAILYKLYGWWMILSGDFMQSVYYENGDAFESLWITLADHKQMRDNFRNTLETVKFAHSIFGEEAKEMFLAERVVKRGLVPSSIQWINAVVDRIKTLVKQWSSSICVIYHDIEQGHGLYNMLWYTHWDMECVFPGWFAKHRKALLDEYHDHKVHLISYREAKWLEFDYVILLDQKSLLEGNIEYKERLWYIAATRAVRQLWYVE